MKYKENFDVYATILAPENVLKDTSFLDSIINDYKSLDGFFIWIDDFKEDSSSKTDYDLILYRNFIKNLIERTHKPVYIMYGSYFSALMTKYGLTGFCAGVRYGESKKYNYATEEIGKVRFYLPLLKKKIPEGDASRFMLLHPKEICDCDFCAERVNSIKSQNPNIGDRELIMNFFNNMSPKYKVSHFMASRWTEIEEIQANTISEIKQMLKEDYQKIVTLRPQLVKEGLARALSYDHINKWEKAL